MNTRTAPVTNATHYCAGCDKLVDLHICLDCQDYAITVGEAASAGFLLALVPVDCTCTDCVA